MTLYSTCVRTGTAAKNSCQGVSSSGAHKALLLAISRTASCRSELEPHVQKTRKITSTPTNTLIQRSATSIQLLWRCVCVHLPRSSRTHAHTHGPRAAARELPNQNSWELCYGCSSTVGMIYARVDTRFLIFDWRILLERSILAFLLLKVRAHDHEGVLKLIQYAYGMCWTTERSGWSGRSRVGAPLSFVDFFNILW